MSFIVGEDGPDGALGGGGLPRAFRCRGGVVAVIAVVAVVVSVATWVGGWRAEVPCCGNEAVRVIYTSPTASDGVIRLPEAVSKQISDVGRAHGTAYLYGIDGDGTTTTETMDLTPRVDDKPTGAPLTIEARIVGALKKKVAQIEDKMSRAATVGDRSLYRGLLHTPMPSNATVLIASTGVDTTDPLDFRDLAWDTGPDEVLKGLAAAGELPHLPGARITFVLLPLGADQPQLRLAQIDYIKVIWRAVLTKAGAVSVDFIDAPSTSPAGGDVKAPLVPIPDLPDTTKPEKTPQGVTCTLAANSYFNVDVPVLVSRSEARRALGKCVKEAAPGSKVMIDGWTGYRGQLRNGKPATNPPESIKLSQERCEVIAQLLVELGVDRAAIVRIKGHGNEGQPYPKNPRSAKNRLVKVQFTTEGVSR